MNRCKHCKGEIVGEFVRLDAGLRVSTGEVIPHDVNLHPGHYGPWMLEAFPWLAKVTYRDRTSL